LDIHHVADLGFDATTVILCANCHRKVTDAQKNHPPHCDDADTQLEQIARVQLGLAELLKLAVAKLSEYGEALIERASGENA
jgi:predicted metal-binding protein